MWRPLEAPPFETQEVRDERRHGAQRPAVELARYVTDPSEERLLVGRWVGGVVRVYDAPVGGHAEGRAETGARGLGASVVGLPPAPIAAETVPGSASVIIGLLTASSARVERGVSVSRCVS